MRKTWKDYRGETRTYMYEWGLESQTRQIPLFGLSPAAGVTDMRNHAPSIDMRSALGRSL
jgi:hypothetical protein